MPLSTALNNDTFADTDELESLMKELTEPSIKHNDYSGQSSNGQQHAQKPANKSLRDNHLEQQLILKQTALQTASLTPNSPPKVDGSVTIEQTRRLTLVALRRDHITFLALKGNNFKNMKVINTLANKYQCTPLDIMNDLKLLSQPELWQKHKNRLKKAQVSAHHYQTELAHKRKTKVSGFMERSIDFNADVLVALSKQFDCQPRHIVDDIMQYKTFANLKQVFKDANSKMPTIRAISRYTKLNLRY